MYARVARWEGGDGEAMRRAGEEIKARAESGPPEGVPAKGLLLLMDTDNGIALAISLFETEEGRRKGDEMLSSMTPPNEDMGRRVAVENYEVAADVRM